MSEPVLRSELPGNVLVDVLNQAHCDSVPQFQVAMSFRMAELWERYERVGTLKQYQVELERCVWTTDRLYRRMRIVWGSLPLTWRNTRFSHSDVSELLFAHWIEKESLLQRRFDNAIILQDRVLSYGPAVYANPDLTWPLDVRLSESECRWCLRAALASALDSSAVGATLSDSAKHAMTDANLEEISRVLRERGIYMMRHPGIEPDSGQMRAMLSEVDTVPPYQIHDPKRRELAFVYQVALSLFREDLALLEPGSR